MTRRQFARRLKMRGVKVTCGLALEWYWSRCHAERVRGGTCGRRVAYSRYSPAYGAWVEPKVSYATWAEAFDAYLLMISGTKDRNWTEE